VTRIASALSVHTAVRAEGYERVATMCLAAKGASAESPAVGTGGRHAHIAPEPRKEQTCHQSRGYRHLQLPSSLLKTRIGRRTSMEEHATPPAPSRASRSRLHSTPAPLSRAAPRASQPTSRLRVTHMPTVAHLTPHSPAAILLRTPFFREQTSRCYLCFLVLSPPRLLLHAPP